MQQQKEENETSPTKNYFPVHKILPKFSVVSNKTNERVEKQIPKTLFSFQ